MNRLLSILLLFCVYSHLYAQTPYDSFSPATSRPILDVVQNIDTYKDSLRQTQMDIAIATTDDVSKWLSPDPLSDKYPEISPYSYCNWNPVKYIDPDGRDNFEVNWNPEANKLSIKQIKNKKYDQFHIVDNDGNRIACSKQYDYGTITKLRNSSWGKSNLSLFDVNGDDNAEDLFKFLSSNFTAEKDSPLEWSRVMVGTSTSGRNIIGTSMKEKATGVGHYIMYNGYTIRGVDHNHPYGTGPSVKDIKNAKIYHNKYPSAQLRVYTGGDYKVYDQGGVIYSLDEIVVTGNKQ